MGGRALPASVLVAGLLIAASIAGSAYWLDRQAASRHGEVLAMEEKLVLATSRGPTVRGKSLEERRVKALESIAISLGAKPALVGGGLAPEWFPGGSPGE